jgi:hypothetical protein
MNPKDKQQWIQVIEEEHNIMINSNVWTAVSAVYEQVRQKQQNIKYMGHEVEIQRKYQVFQYTRF